MRESSARLWTVSATGTDTACTNVAWNTAAWTTAATWCSSTDDYYWLGSNTTATTAPADWVRILRPALQIANEAMAPRVWAEPRDQRTNEEREAESAILGPMATDPASLRARQLLLSLLTSEQRGQFKRFRSFEVRSQRGRRYRIDYYRHRNVKLLGPEGQVVKVYCAGPRDHLPLEDVLLAQKVMLEVAEDQFHAEANEMDRSLFNGRRSSLRVA